jgi:cell wall-associated NlpC family hydrolase
MVRAVKYIIAATLLSLLALLSSFRTSPLAGETYSELSDSTEQEWDSSVALIDSLLGQARSYLGTPYKYGARGPSQFDCSGYTAYVFRQIEINLPVTSRTQAKEGVPVSLDSAYSGDLIFFTSPRSGTSVGHVGIITKNDSTGIYFIHSSTYRGVVEDRLEGYYKKRFLEARRIFSINP